MWLKSAANETYSALQKGLHVGEQILSTGATIKGLYDVGRNVYSMGRVIAPAIGML